MKKYIFIVCLLLTAPGLTHARTTDGTIVFDYPDAPHAKFQFHFTRELITLAATTAPFNTVSDVYIRTYHVEADIFDRFAQYYGETLKAENWQHLQEDNGVHLYILEAPSAESLQSDKAVSGIFAVVQSDSDVYLLNVVGNIPPQQARQLLANLGQIGIEVPALKSLDAQTFQIFETPPEPIRLPTLFRTEAGEPIHEIRIQGHQETHPNDVRKALEKGPEEIEKAIVALPGAMSGLEEVRFRIEEEGARRTAIVTIVETPLPSRFYFDSAPWAGFNRVTGWELGARC